MTAADLLASARTNQIKSIAERLGFQECKIATAKELTQDARNLENWLNSNRHGQMDYMSNHFDLRINPQKLVPGAKSVIVLSKNYFTPKTQTLDAPKISQYAFGRDYHKVIKKQIKLFFTELKDHFGDINGRGFVDSAPVLEKAWARESGLGWMGKHSNIISKKSGSFFFLAVLVTDLILEPDTAIKDYCGTCTACIDACPTEAIVAPYQVDGSKCISYFTIELKSHQLPQNLSGKFDNWMFGCDICQDVCPWNRFSEPHGEPEFEPKESLLNMSSTDWNQLTRERFDEMFHGSAVKRTGFDGLVRNIKFLSSSSEKEGDLD